MCSFLFLFKLESGITSLKRGGVIPSTQHTSHEIIFLPLKEYGKHVQLCTLNCAGCQNELGIHNDLQY